MIKFQPCLISFSIGAALAGSNLCAPIGSGPSQVPPLHTVMAPKKASSSSSAATSKGGSKGKGKPANDDGEDSKGKVCAGLGRLCEYGAHSSTSLDHRGRRARAVAS